MSEPIDFKAHRDRRQQAKAGSDPDDMGTELLFSVHHYERGHVTFVPSEHLPADAQAIFRRMFDTLWYEAGHTFKVTDNAEDELLVLVGLFANGRVISYHDHERIQTTDHRDWVEQQLVRMAREDIQIKIGTIPAPANTNKEPTP